MADLLKSIFLTGAFFIPLFTILTCKMNKRSRVLYSIFVSTGTFILAVAAATLIAFTLFVAAADYHSNEEAEDAAESEADYAYELAEANRLIYELSGKLAETEKANDELTKQINDEKASTAALKKELTEYEDLSDEYVTASRRANLVVWLILGCFCCPLWLFWKRICLIEYAGNSFGIKSFDGMGPFWLAGNIIYSIVVFIGIVAVLYTEIIYSVLNK